MSTMDPLEAKLGKLVDRLQDGRPDHLAEVQSMQKALKAAMLKKNLKEHPALKQFFDTLRKREQSYTTVIANKRDMSELDRREFFAKRDEIRLILSFFNVDSTIGNIEKTLDYQLSDEVEESGDIGQ
jgi:hypothetical protein